MQSYWEWDGGVQTGSNGALMTRGGNFLQTKHEFTGDIAITIDMHISQSNAADQRSEVAIFGESVELAFNWPTEGDRRIQLVRRGNRLNIVVNGGASFVEIKEANLDKPSRLRITHAGREALIRSMTIQALDAQLPSNK